VDFATALDQLAVALREGSDAEGMEGDLQTRIRAPGGAGGALLDVEAQAELVARMAETGDGRLPDHGSAVPRCPETCARTARSRLQAVGEDAYGAHHGAAHAGARFDERLEVRLIAA
jgi:hypothetical protein